MEITGIMWIVLLLSLLVCAYMEWNIGANDVANGKTFIKKKKYASILQKVRLVFFFPFYLLEFLSSV